MSRWVLMMLVLALLLASTARVVYADDAEEAEADAPVDDEVPEEEDAKKSMDAAGIAVRTFFPGNDKRIFPAGQYGEALVAVENTADQDYRVEYVLAYLQSSLDSTFFIQNFTGGQYNRTAAPGSITNIKYRFKPDPAVEPREYTLLVQTFYQNDDNDTFLSVAFNDTITVAEAPTQLDIQTLTSYGVPVVFIGVVAYMMKDKLMPAPAKQARRRSGSVTSPEMGTDVQNVDFDFVPSEHVKYVSGTPTTPATPGNKRRK